MTLFNKDFSESGKDRQVCIKVDDIVHGEGEDLTFTGSNSIIESVDFNEKSLKYKFL